MFTYPVPFSCGLVLIVVALALAWGDLPMRSASASNGVSLLEDLMQPEHTFTEVAALCGVCRQRPQQRAETVTSCSDRQALLLDSARETDALSVSQLGGRGYTASYH